jgi:hypothetical protein
VLPGTSQRSIVTPKLKHPPGLVVTEVGPSVIAPLPVTGELPFRTTGANENAAVAQVPSTPACTGPYKVQYKIPPDPFVPEARVVPVSIVPTLVIDTLDNVGTELRTRTVGAPVDGRRDVEAAYADEESVNFIE